jgi:hypothetical protein
VQVEAVSHDALLQASRRVDWRFLLPEPDLGRVAYIGATDRGLVESLGLFSAELTVLQSAVSANGQAAPYDLVVLRDPSTDELETARSLLSARGWVYVEVESSLRRMQALASRSARGYARALRKLGFVDVEAHMHWPDFGSCRAIVRLDDTVAVRQAMARGRRGGRARLVTRLGPALAATRQLALFVPCASVLGRLASSPGTVIR